MKVTYKQVVEEPIQNHTHRIFRLFSALLIVCFLASGLVRPAHASWAYMNVSFVGGGAVHLDFVMWGENPKDLNVFVKVNGANFTTLVIPAGTLKYRHAGLPLDSIVSYINQDTGEPLTSADTSKLSGTMLFDENIYSVTVTTSGSSEVIVSGSNSLTISDSIFRGGLRIITQENGSAHVVRTTVEEGAGFSNDASQTNHAIIVEDSVFDGQGVALSGGVSFKGNEVRNRVSIWRHSDILIQNNIIEGPIEYECHIDMSDCDWSQGPYPTILGNSFLGDTAFRKPFFISLPITHIGSNYYGDPNVVNGSVDPFGNNHRIFLKERGAWNDSWGAIVMDDIASWGKTVQKLKPSIESVHLNSYIIGQNTIAHKSKIWSGMMGRKTLLSIDLGTSFSTLKEVKVIVHFNGKDYVKKDITLHNTIHNCVGFNIGECTIDFELDPVLYTDSPGVNIPITVDVDLSEVPGSKYLSPYQVINDTIGFFSPPKRPLKINVIPINMGWLCSGRADGGTTAGILRDYLPPMFALRKQDIELRLLPPHTYNCITPLAALSPTLIAEGIVAETAAIDKLLESDPADLLVVVVPAQALRSLVSTDIEGMSLKYLRSVILVNEAFPYAVLHEMGHWAGMYSNPEQYDQYQPYGLPFRNSTSYDPDGKKVKEMRRQIEHFTEPGFYGWTEDRIYDTMSNQNFTWPLYETTQSMQIAIYKLLGHKGAASPAEAKLAAPEASAPTLSASGMRTLYFYSETIRDYAGGGYGAYYLKPGSLHMLDLTGMGLNPGDSPERTTQYTEHLSYDLTGYDAAGTPVFSSPIVTYLNDDYGTVVIPSIAFIYHTIQVPEIVVRVVVTDPPAIGNQIYLDQSLGGSVESQFVTPTAGSTLGSGDITLTWTNPSPHLLHLLAYSADNGLTWNSSGDLPFEGDSIVIPNEALPVSNQLMFRLFTTNGFSHFEDRVGNLVVVNRAPQVHITSPQDGLAVPPGTKIILNAQVTDLEDGGISTGNWTSSIDGALGQGHFLPDITLSAGTHTLSFSTQDSAGAVASQQVTVLVGAVSQVDLKLDADAISLLYLHMGVGNQLHSLSSATTYTVRVNIQGVGVESTPTLGLYVTPRGGTETLLKTEALTLSAFADGTIETSFTPPVTGEYTFRAAIESSIPSDSNPANNTATLDISGLPPGYSVSGRVQAKIYGSPIPWVEITDELGQKTLAKQDCLYTLKNIQPGTHTLTIVKDGVLFDPVTVEVTNANVTDFILEGTPVKFGIFGYVALPGVVVSDGVGNQVLTDSIGRFFTRSLPPGTYNLTFSKPGYMFFPSSVTVQVVDNIVYLSQNFVITEQGNNMYLPLILRR